jgi:hypothetical protein
MQFTTSGKARRFKPLVVVLAEARLRNSLEALRSDPSGPVAGQYFREAFAALDDLEGGEDGRYIGDGIDADFEHLAAEDWPAWTDDDRWTTTEPTPIEVLAAEEALGLPALCGGSPDDDREPAGPTAEDWADYGRWCEARAAADQAEELHRLGYGR